MAIGIVTHAPVENSTLFIESWSRTLFTELAQSDTPEKPAGNVDGKNCVAFFGQIIQDQSTISLLWPGFLAPKRMCLIVPKMELTYITTSVSA